MEDQRHASQIQLLRRLYQGSSEHFLFVPRQIEKVRERRRFEKNRLFRFGCESSSIFDWDIGYFRYETQNELEADYF